jgi:hypothetical protein
MSQRLFALFSGPIVVLLVMSSPAEAQPLYRSDLDCAAHPEARGFASIDRGGLYVKLDVRRSAADRGGC